MAVSAHSLPFFQITSSSANSASAFLAETINGLYKAEVIHRREPRRSFEAVEYATVEWVDSIPSAEAEEPYYAMLDDVSMAAQL